MENAIVDNLRMAKFHIYEARECVKAEYGAESEEANTLLGIFLELDNIFKILKEEEGR